MENLDIHRNVDIDADAVDVENPVSLFRKGC